ncbi:MAG: hypothetical protein WCV90_04270 [Candidatus Woesearchaeota archaeon]|jgi:hypothetical protein
MKIGSAILLVERFYVHRNLMKEMLQNWYQVLPAVMKESNIPYESRREPDLFITFDSPDRLKELLDDPKYNITGAIFNIESFSSSNEDNDRGDLFNDYFSHIAVPQLTKIVLTSSLPETEARERYTPAFADARTTYLKKPFVTEDLIGIINKD